MTQKPGIAGSIAAIVGGYTLGTIVALRFTNVPAEELAAATQAAA